MASSHHDFLQHHLLSDVLCESKPLIVLNSETKLDKCLEMFNKNHMHSAPVFDEHDKEFTGIIDVFSILSFLLMRGEANAGQLMNWLQTVPCSELPKSKICAMEPCESLLSFLKLNSSKKCGRTLVHLMKHFQSEPSYNLVSETDIAKFLAKNVDKLGNISQQSLEDLHLFDFSNKSKMILLKPDEPAINGFQRMFEAKTRVAGIIQNDKLIGTLSCGDLTGLTADKVERLFLPINQFIEKFSVPTSFFKNDTLGTAFIKTSGAKVHCAWVVDSAERPLGIISLFDLLDVLVRDDVSTPGMSLEKMGTAATNPTKQNNLIQA